MRIAVNTRLLLKNKMDGIGWFTHFICKNLVLQHPEHEFIFIFDRGYDSQYVYGSNVTPVVLSPQSRHPFLWYYWFEVGIPSIIKKFKADVFFSPDGFMPLNSNVPVLSAIHDINFYYRPQDLPRMTSWYYNTFFPLFANKATRIITVSECSKNDISRHYRVPLEKIDVVYNGVGEDFNPLREVDKKLIKEKYTKGRPYFLFVGTVLPRKNLKNLMLAFQLFKEKTGLEHQLLVAGHHKFGFKELMKVKNTLSFAESITFLGRIPDKDLPGLMGAADALTYLPFYEGFGIPVIEAMQCRVPVLTSNVSALPEICEDAAALADPHDVSEIAEYLVRLTDDDFKKTIIEKGASRVAEFSWEKSARVVWESLKKTVATG